MNNYNKAYHVLLIGATGVGKSSIIKLFTHNKEIRTSGSSESSTGENDIKMYYENDERCWIDSMGTNDSKCKLNDDQILFLSQKLIYYSKLNNHNIKIIWVMYEDIKMTQTLQKQCEFIFKFGPNIYKSLLIIISKPTIGKNIRLKVQGALDCISKYTPYYNEIPIYAFNILEWIDKNNIPDIIYELNPKDRQQMFYYTEEEMYNEINKTLSLLPYITVHYNMKKCLHCGIKGDERFCIEKCHPIIRKLNCHLSIIKKHPKLLINKLISTVKYESYERQCKKHHTNMDTRWKCDTKVNEIGKIVSFGLSRVVGLYFEEMTCHDCGKRDLTQYYHCFGCCNYGHSRSQSKIYENCNGVYCYSCIDRNSYVTKQKHIYEERYECCNGAKDFKGCDDYCINCNKFVIENGINTIGCIASCQSCQGKWGDSEGCMNVKHNFN